MLNEDKEPKNAESESSGDEDHSIGWLEVLAEEPGAIWDRTSTPSPELSEELQPQPDQDSDQADALALDNAVVNQNEVDPQSERTPGGKDSREGDAMQDGSVLAGQGLDSRVDPTSGWSIDQQEAHDLGDEVILENDDLMWLDEMDTVPKMNSDSQESDDKTLTGVSGEPADEEKQGQNTNESADGEPAILASDEVPEDPDEAIAWLERLAARQGASSEELPSVQSDVSPDAELAAPEETEFYLPQGEAGEIPEDPDEAMAWLERLAARQGVDTDELTTAQADGVVAEPSPSTVLDDTAATEPGEVSPIADLDEALDWLEELTVHQGPDQEMEADAAAIPVSEELPTPAVAHDVAEAMAGADLLFAEPESVPSAEVADAAVGDGRLEDGDDAMAWLEQLAARQGAPIEELTTFEEEEIAGQVEPEFGQDSASGIDPAPELEEVLEDIAESGEAIATAEAVGLPAVEVSAEPAAAEPAAEAEDAVADEDVPAVGLSAVEVAAKSAAEAEDAVVDEEVPAAGLLAVEVAAKPATEAEGAAADENVPAEDLAWLDALGDVDAESWLEAEAAVEQIKTAPEPIEAPVTEPLEITEEEVVEPGPLATILPEAHGSEELAQAREAMQEGAVEEGLEVYSALVDKGESLPFLIDDLETFYEGRGPEPRLQRVLGDAYARNGQLQKALRVYREALDNL